MNKSISQFTQTYSGPINPTRIYAEDLLTTCSECQRIVGGYAYCSPECFLVAFQREWNTVNPPLTDAQARVEVEAYIKATEDQS